MVCIVYTGKGHGTQLVLTFVLAHLLLLLFPPYLFIMAWADGSFYRLKQAEPGRYSEFVGLGQIQVKNWSQNAIIQNIS